MLWKQHFSFGGSWFLFVMETSWARKTAGERLPMHLFTDCKSLYDHLHREGVPRPPSEKRLAIELAAIRQALTVEGRHQWKEKHGSGEVRPDRPLKVPIHWLPTDKQWADILTKKMTSTLWWQSIGEALLSFPFTVPKSVFKTRRRHTSVNVTDMSWHISFPMQVASTICQSAAVMALSPFQAHE